MEITNHSKYFVTLALLADSFRKNQEAVRALDERVEAYNAFAKIVSSKYDFGTRTQAIVRLGQRAQNVCADTESDSIDRAREMRRILHELAGVLRNYNRDNASM